MEEAAPPAAAMAEHQHQHQHPQQTDMFMEMENVGKAFIEHYFTLFDKDRASLSCLYHPTSSLLSFEGHQFHGVDAISAKLSGLPFTDCRHCISTLDCQPSGVTGGVLVFVSGSLLVSGEDHPLRFSQMFHLVPTPQGSYFVQNDIFRLNYG